MKKFITIVLAIMLTLSGVFASGAQESAADDGTVKVALLLSGPANDQGWNAIAVAGLQAAQEKYGIETSIMENLGITDTEAAYRDYASQGYDLVIGHGFQFGAPAAKVSADFPNQYFMATESASQTENMASYVTSCNEGAYIMGMLAAYMTKSNIVGVEGAMVQPSITKELEAFKLAVKEVNPDIKVLSVYINSYTDVTKGKEAAISMIDQGADVLYHVANQAGTGLIKACEEADILALGNSYDQNSISPNHVISSTSYDIPNVIVKAIENVINGTFSGGIYNLGMADDIVQIAPYHSFDSVLSQEVKDIISERISQIKDGSFVVPTIETPTN
ncbi:MAG: BMP family protein [Sphaerochaetaceae bacterium]|nr:BMP family protein [Sphaerochaetaceae bacterium]MDC7238257.1 BMP family protein [Sphaerochaetaceae bacterium]MDC7249586.1 BMP family protein [Sphaerochaetaceae bacterium]